MTKAERKAYQVAWRKRNPHYHRRKTQLYRSGGYVGKEARHSAEWRRIVRMYLGVL